MNWTLALMFLVTFCIGWVVRSSCHDEETNVIDKFLMVLSIVALAAIQMNWG